MTWIKTNWLHLWIKLRKKMPNTLMYNSQQLLMSHLLSLSFQRKCNEQFLYLNVLNPKWIHARDQCQQLPAEKYDLSVICPHFHISTPMLWSTITPTTSRNCWTFPETWNWTVKNSKQICDFKFWIPEQRGLILKHFCDFYEHQNWISFKHFLW